MELYVDLQPQDVGVKAQFCLNAVTEEFQKSLLNNVNQEALLKQNENTKTEMTNEDEFDIVDGDEDRNNKNIDLDENNQCDDNNNDVNNQTPNLDEHGEAIINPSLFKKDEEVKTELKVSSESSKLIEVASSLKRVTPSLFTGYSLSTPFNDAIVLIKSLAYYKVPLEKLTIIASVSAEITESVN